jgi:hypothetical protein
MRTQAFATFHAQLIIACSLLVLAVPVSTVRAQEDLEEMMAADPDRPPEEEEAEGEGEGDEAPPADGEERASGEQGSDEERPPGEEDESDDSVAEGAPAEPVDDPSKGFRIGALLGYGLALEDLNPWGMGFGLQAGYDTGIFVIGARFVYYVGATEEIPQINAFGDLTGTETVTINVWELSVDAGFDVALSQAVTLRPGLGIGFASSGRGSSSELVAAVSPGAALLFAASDSFYVGLDARFQLVTSQPESVKALIFLATAGLRF